MVFGASARIASMMRPMLESSSSIASEYRPSFDLPTKALAGLFGLCIFMKLMSMKKGLLSLACFLMYSTAESAWRTSNSARWSQLNSATLLAGWPATPSHSYMLTALKYSSAYFLLYEGNHGWKALLVSL